MNYGFGVFRCSYEISMRIVLRKYQAGTHWDVGKFVVDVDEGSLDIRKNLNLVL